MLTNDYPHPAECIASSSSSSVNSLLKPKPNQKPKTHLLQSRVLERESREQLSNGDDASLSSPLSLPLSPIFLLIPQALSVSLSLPLLHQLLQSQFQSCLLPFCFSPPRLCVFFFFFFIRSGLKFWILMNFQGGLIYELVSFVCLYWIPHFLSSLLSHLFS